LHGITGYRCRNFEQYVWAIKNIDRIRPQTCRDYALNNFSLEAIAPKYEEFFQQILDVHTGAGWYQMHNIQQIHLPNRYLPPSNTAIDFDEIDQEEWPQAERLALWIKDNINPDSVIDMGCGPGTYTDELNKLYVPTVGLDPDPRTRHQYYNLLDRPTRHADTVICLEVMEHIDPDSADLAIANLVKHVDSTLIFTAARPGQGGSGHINCRPRSYWITKLQEHGLTYDLESTEQLIDYMRQGPHMGWFTQNLIVAHK
jgi:SAM-dependent methyltransferase